MKICTECQFSKRQFVEVAPQQMAPMTLCTHEECRDPVEGVPLPANIARQQVVFCGFTAKFFKPKEEPVKVEAEQGSNLIQLK